MARQTKPRANAKAILEFRSDEEAAEYFETHSGEEFWDRLLPARPIKLPPEQVQAIRERHARRKKIAPVPLEPEQIAQAREIADSKSIDLQTQLRLWIAEGIRRETKRRPTSP